MRRKLGKILDSASHIILLSFVHGVQMKGRGVTGWGWGGGGGLGGCNIAVDNCLCSCFLQRDRPVKYGCHGRPSFTYPEET